MHHLMLLNDILLMRIAVGYTMDTMYFSWLDKAAEVDDANQMPQFSLEDIQRYECSQNYTGGQIALRYSNLCEDSSQAMLSTGNFIV